MKRTAATPAPRLPIRLAATAMVLAPLWGGRLALVLRLICPATLAPKDTVTVSITEGLVSNTGVRVPVGERVLAVESFRANLVMAECSSLLFEP